MGAGKPGGYPPEACAIIISRDRSQRLQAWVQATTSLFAGVGRGAGTVAIGGHDPSMAAFAFVPIL